MKLLRVTAPHFVAGAVYEKVEGKWQCVRAAPILKWLRVYPVKDVAMYLRTKRWTWEWI